MEAITLLPRTAWILFRTHLGRTIRSRRTLLLLGIALIPAAIMAAATLARSFDPAFAVSEISWMLLFQVVVPLLALVAGSSVIADEVADRTIAYVVTRPVSRAGFFLGRFFATFVVVFLLVALAVVAMALPLLARGHAVPKDLLHVVLDAATRGAFAYAAVFAAIGALVKHPLVAGAAYAFAIEGLFANLPGTTRSLAIQHHLRAVVLGRGGPAWRRMSDVLDLKLYPALGEAISTLWIVALVALLLGALIISRKQYVVAS